MNATITAWICMTIMVLAMVTCSIAPREDKTVACVRAGGEWTWFSCKGAVR